MPADFSPFSPLCYYSPKHRYIWIHVAKNASSTLGSIFGHDRHDASSNSYLDLPEEVRRDYTTIVFLRHPIERTLSAYQEVSLRADIVDGYLIDREFVQMPAGLERFSAFLDAVSQDPWDDHVLSQTQSIRGARVDLWGTVETIEPDLVRICGRVGISPPERVWRYRSRAERMATGRYRTHNLYRRDLTPELLERILDVYREDDEIYRRVIRDRP